MRLSILVCSVTKRVSNFLPNIISKLEKQASFYEDVEIICLLDNKKIMLGEKRNMLVGLATGQYVVFVDDDDDVSDDYVTQLYNATESNSDVITFTVNVSLNGGEYKPCFYSIDFKCDQNFDDRYERLPNHIMCVKKSIAIETPYKNILYGEDSAYSKDLISKLNSERKINKVLYFYNYNIDVTETQQHLRRYNRNK